MKKDAKITIIGAGIVGSSIALELVNNGYSNITVLERNSEILARNQSTTNEGTIHSGIYHPKEVMPLKAKLAVEGNALMYQFLDAYQLPYKKTGKLIIATNEFEESYLDFFLQVGKENGIKGIEKISGEKARELEPNLSSGVTAALLVPSAGVTSPLALLMKVYKLGKEKGVMFHFNTTVTEITSDQNMFRITIQTNGEEKKIETDYVINAAGLYSDIIGRMINPNLSYEIEPARGEFFHFDKTKRENISMHGMHVYQPPYCYSTKEGKVSVEKIPANELKEKLQQGDLVITAGVHLSPTFDFENGTSSLGTTVTISPLKTVGFGKEDYETGLHPAFDYIQKVHYFFPSIQEDDIEFDHTGIMCPLIGYRDFVIEKDALYPHAIQLIGMESPSWTACFAIAKYVATLLEK